MDGKEHLIADDLGYEYDVFISHAGEDKDVFVRPLVDALTAVGLTVWYDETELVPGCSLIETVERGLSQSRFGVIVLSQAFFAKNWPRKELNALASREFATGESVLIPIWLGVKEADVRDYSPLLADRWAIRADDLGVDEVAGAIRDVVRPDGSSTSTGADWLDEEERRRTVEFGELRETYLRSHTRDSPYDPEEAVEWALRSRPMWDYMVIPASHEYFAGTKPCIQATARWWGDWRILANVRALHESKDTQTTQRVVFGSVFMGGNNFIVTYPTDFTGRYGGAHPLVPGQYIFDWALVGRPSVVGREAERILATDDVEVTAEMLDGNEIAKPIVRQRA